MSYLKRKEGITQHTRPQSRLRKKTYNKFGKKLKKYIPQGFPQSTTCRLRYCETGTIDSGGTATTNVYSANSLYDPSTTNLGHQCMYYDTYANIYDEYVVLGSKINVTFWTENAATTYASIVGVKLDDDSSLGTTNIQQVIEQPNRLTKYRFLRNNSTSGDNTIVKVSNTYSAKKFNGVKDVKDNRALLGANVTANPTEGAYFILFVAHPDGATDIPAINYQVSIDYIAQFSELRDVSQS